MRFVENDSDSLTAMSLFMVVINLFFSEGDNDVYNSICCWLEYEWQSLTRVSGLFIQRDMKVLVILEIVAFYPIENSSCGILTSEVPFGEILRSLFFKWVKVRHSFHIAPGGAV